MIKKYSEQIRAVLTENKIKWSLLIISMICTLALAGYFTILFGGKLIIEDEKFILDATTTIETQEGEKIGELYHENRIPVTLAQIPLHVQEAFIAIEDGRFYKHAGIDMKSVARAVYRDIIAFGKVEGASTITQQLVKNLFLYNDKTWMRKTKEVMAAIYLEREYSKDEIMELYLNSIYFGHGVYGVEAASQKFYSKSVKDLTIGEGALIAGLAKAPNGYSPINNPEQALKRRNLVLKVMNDATFINTEKRLKEQGKTLGLNIQERKVQPWVDSYVDLVMKEAADKYQLTINELKRGGYRIIVNIDEAAQKIAYDAFKQDKYFPGNTAGVEGAFVMTDQKTGEVKAALGGRDYQLGDLNRAVVKRQPGSTFKPLAVFGPAMMDETYGPYTLLKDEKVAYDDYVATNIDDQYHGEISMYETLMKSKNAPTVWLLDQIGIDYSKDYLAKMNLHISDEGLAIALGGLSEGVSPLHMAQGYQTFAHEGVSIEPFTISAIYNQADEQIAVANPVNTEVFNAQVAWNMTEMLLSAVESGTAQSGNYSKALAGKTGTTGHPHVEGMVKDAWFVGYTPEYVTALWMGYDRSDQDHYLTEGSSYPTELTKDILSELDKITPLKEKFTKPDHVKTVPKPIELPVITDLDIAYVFGGIPLIKGKLSWVGSKDERVVYRIYRKESEIDERIGEITGTTEFVIDHVNLFKTDHFYVVPYDPLTKVEGEPSQLIELSM